MRNLNSVALVLDPASDLQQQRSRWAVSTGCARGYQRKYSTCSLLSSPPGDRNSCPLILQHGYDMNHTHPFPTIYTASSPGTDTVPYPGFPPPGIPHPGAQYAYPPVPPHLIVGHPNAVPNGAPYPASPVNGGFFYPPSPTASGPMPLSRNAPCVSFINHKLCTDTDVAGAYRRSIFTNSGGAGSPRFRDTCPAQTFLDDPSLLLLQFLGPKLRLFRLLLPLLLPLFFLFHLRRVRSPRSTAL